MRSKRVYIQDWGKDHYSVLLYLEVRILDSAGQVDRLHMRTDAELHPQFAHGDGARYPTRLRGQLVQEQHDDWSCVEDMVAEGLIEWWGTGANPVFHITDIGVRVADKLRYHKFNGGRFATFTNGPPFSDTRLGVLQLRANQQ